LSCEEKPLIYDEEWHESEKKIPTPPRIHEESLGVWGFTNTIPFCYLSSYCEYFADL
jgi:hypothetical protein